MPSTGNIAAQPPRDPYPLTPWSRGILALLGVECVAVAWSMWSRPPPPVGRTDITVIDFIPVLGVLWPWLFSGLALLLFVTAATGWNKWLHVILSLGFGVHASYGLTSLAVSVVNKTGWVNGSLALGLALFYLASAIRLTRGQQ
jgi:hypothetical protein